MSGAALKNHDLSLIIGEPTNYEP